MKFTTNEQYHAALDKWQRIVSQAEKEKRDLTPSEVKETRDIEDACTAYRKPNFKTWGSGSYVITEDREIPIDDYDFGGLSGQSSRPIEERRYRRDDYGRAEVKLGRYRYDPQGNDLRSAFNRYIQLGPNALSPSEYRNLQMDDDIAGGYLSAPLEIVREVIKGLDDAVFVRKLARLFTLKEAHSLGAPELASDIGDATWTSELKTGSEDETMNFSRRDLTPHPLARRIRVSNKLLRMGSISPEELVRERLQVMLGEVLENAYLNGTGSNQPLGVFTASDLGIDTSRDVSTGNTNTALTYDGIVNAVAELKPQYRKNAVWIMHRDVEAHLRKLKSGAGDPLWQPGMVASAPNTLLGFPIHLSEWAPSTFTSGNYLAILMDPSFYWIADALNMQIQRLTELYAETNQTGFIIRMESDGAPVLAEAFVRVTLT